MNHFRRKGLLLSSLLFSSALFADTIDDEDGGGLDRRDIQALREWINTKRQVTVKEIGGSLSISGEVRFEFQSANEVKNGIRQTGKGSAIYTKDGFRSPTNSYDVEVNLMLDYRTDRTWAAIKLEFDNDAGTFGGTLNKLKLEKAYYGARLIETDTISFDAEMGRRRLSNFLDSKLEFASFFDGLLFRFEKGFEKAGDFYGYLGGFVVDERYNQYGYVGELGLLNIASTGLYAKYSLMDWDTRRAPHPIENRSFDYIISQFLLGYRFVPAKLNKAVQVYAAGLYNHKAKRQAITDYKRANAGGYLGFSIGQTRRKGDWAFDANYQVLQAQAVPDFDSSGIGFGNSDNSGFYTAKMDGKGALNSRADAGGNVNFRGFQLTLEYLLSDAIMLQQMWQQSITLDTDIGPFRRYKQYEIEFIYAF